MPVTHEDLAQELPFYYVGLTQSCCASMPATPEDLAHAVARLLDALLQTLGTMISIHGPTATQTETQL